MASRFTPAAMLSCAAASMALGGISLLAASILIVSESRGARGPQGPAPAPEPERVCISQSQYQAALDLLAERAATPLPQAIWASRVVEVSSEYTSQSWSAAQVLGEPDTYPSGGDNSTAWASLAADGKTEFIEVAMPAHRASGVQVYETYNPGAIRSIEIRLESGALQRVFTGEPRPRGESARIEDLRFSCTDDKVVGVRVTLDTSAVTGWNEIDAISVRPCR